MLNEAIEELKAAVDALVAADARSLADDESIVALHQQLARLEAVNARATAAFDASQSWQASGARTAAAWLTWKLRLPAATAKRRVRLGRVLRCLPAVEAAWLAGDITDAHVATIARARTDTTAAAMARDEDHLVDHAKTLRFSQFHRVVAYWEQHADPDGAERSAERLHAERAAYLSTTFQGAKKLDATFDPVSGAIFERELQRLEHQLVDADRAEAKQRLGREPTSLELRRTPAQRRHDALVEMAARSASTPKQARRPVPLFTVFVGWETLQGRICELANGTVVTPGSLVPYLTTADFERVVFDSPSRVIDVGVRRRLFEGATRRAVEARDRECFHETCEEREDLQIDHIQPYSWGGPTSQANGRAACAGHNRDRHKRQRRRRP